VHNKVEYMSLDRTSDWSILEMISLIVVVQGGRGKQLDLVFNMTTIYCNDRG